MRKILVASSKGGCGKTTVATNLATCWAQHGHNTVLVDADPQASSLNWSRRRPDNVPGILGMVGRRNALQHVPEDTAIVIIDTAAGTSVNRLDHWLEEVDAVVVPILPSAIDLEATMPYLESLAAYPRIKRGKLPVALVGNRLKLWTHASQDALAEMDEFPFPVVAELRDTQAYVLLASLGKGLFDYQSEQIRSHQKDWNRLQHWLHRNTSA